MEEKKVIQTTIMDGEEFTMVTSDLLKMVKMVNNISDNDVLELIPKYFEFILRWWWLIIGFMIFALFTNGGIECDIIIAIVLVVSLLWGSYYSKANGIAVRFMFLSGSSYTWDSFEAADNTLKEADYLIPKLKECEKQTDLEIRREMYNALVREMDNKYGVRKHMLGKGYSKEEEKNNKEQSEIEKVKKEARECACRDVIVFLKKVDELYDKIWVEHEKKSVHELSALFDLDMFLRDRHNYSSQILYKRYRFNLMNRPNDNIFNTFDEEYYNIYYTIVGDPYQYSISNNCALAALIYLNTKRMFKDFDISYPYYNENDLAACMEGKMVYEIIQKINEYPEIKAVYDEIELFPEITDEMYQMMCKKIKESNYTIDNLRERMK